MTKSIAIIGGGIVGASVAFYLTEMGHAVTLFDEGTGQATSAAAGIICPWLSLRRNKAWYRLAAGGAAFYGKLIADLEKDQSDVSFYKQSGAVILKENQKRIEALYQKGVERRKTAPEIGALKILDNTERSALLPTLRDQEHTLYVGGGARVDGNRLVESLLENMTGKGGKVCREKAVLKEADSRLRVVSSLGEQSFDSIVLAAGAWLPQILEPLGWEVDIRPQKGELAVLQLKEADSRELPVIIPQGEIDILPLENGKVIVGASHENEKGYDLEPDPEIVERLIQDGRKLFSRLENAELIEVKVGTRAYTSDFSPFFGRLPSFDSVLMASGLGSSGLTTGPYIGYQLALMAAGFLPEVPEADYAPDAYLKKKQ